MFVLGASDSFWWPVSVEIPADDGGQLEKHEFTIRYARLTQPRIAEIVKAIQAGETQDLDVCTAIVVGWRDIVDAGKAPVPYNDANRTKLFESPLVMAAIIRAWFAALRGGPRKN